MPMEPIKTEDEYKTALARSRGLFDAEPGTPELTELLRLIDQIEAYEDEHYPI